MSICVLNVVILLDLCYSISKIPDFVLGGWLSHIWSMQEKLLVDI